MTEKPPPPQESQDFNPLKNLEPGTGTLYGLYFCLLMGYSPETVSQWFQEISSGTPEGNQTSSHNLNHAPGV